MSRETLDLMLELNHRELETQVALQCAPLLTGLKISNLLTVSKAHRNEVIRLFRDTAVSCFLLYESEEKVTFLLYSREKLERYLRQKDVRELMEHFGYQGMALGLILRKVALRYGAHMEEKADFPHEIGLLLGYPTKDVSGFIDLLNGASSEILDQARLWISDLKSQETEELFQDIKIHRTEILGYTKEKGTCTITIQTSVQYLHYKRRNGQILSGSEEYLEQSRYNMELQYVQDENKAAGEGAAVGITCPQCGAPVTRLGEAFCEYCGTAVTRVNIRSWQFIKIRS